MLHFTCTRRAFLIEVSNPPALEQLYDVKRASVLNFVRSSDMKKAILLLCRAQCNWIEPLLLGNCDRTQIQTTPGISGLAFRLPTQPHLHMDGGTDDELANLLLTCSDHFGWDDVPDKRNEARASSRKKRQSFSMQAFSKGARSFCNLPSKRTIKNLEACRGGVPNS